MPQIRLDLPDSISKDVLEKDLSYYFGGDAEIVRQKGSHYVIDSSSSQNLQSILQRLREDTATWRASDEYQYRDYSQSKAHRDRKHSATSHTSGYASARRESITSSMATSSMPAPSRRPSMPHRNSSTSGSVIESPLGTSYQSTHSFSQSSTYSSQSRRPSEAMLPVRPGFRSRTDSMSSNSSDYGIDGYYGFQNSTGTDGYYGFQNSTGTDGYYGWRQENGRSAPQYRKP